MAEPQSRARLITGVMAAFSCVIVVLIGCTGFAGVIAGLIVDVPEALQSLGIEISESTAVAFVNWGITVVLIVLIWVFAFGLMYQWKLLPWQAFGPTPGSHGLPVKRALEQSWRETIQEFIATASELGRSTKKAAAWRSLVVETFENRLVNPHPDRRIFLKRTKSIARGKDLANAVDRGVRYLDSIKDKDGGELR